MSPGKRMLAMMREMEGMRGYMLTRELQRLDLSVFILTTNYTSLKSLIEGIGTDPRVNELIIARNRDQLEILFMHITRLIHNFAAAVMSLKEHTFMICNVWNERAGGRRFPDLQARKDADFTHDPLAQFILRFRNYCQHCGPPPIQLAVHFEATDTGMRETKTVALSTQELLQWKDWGSHGRRYLTDNSKQIDILEAATAYWTKVLAYTAWFRGREQDLFADEIRQFMDKQREYALLNLETEIDARLAGNNKVPFLLAKEEVFVGLFSSDHFEHLKQTPADSMERAKLAILLVERDFFPLPDAIKRKIEMLFTTDTGV